jgi:hypothetical protein
MLVSASFLLGVMVTYPLFLVLGLWRPVAYARLFGGGRIRLAFAMTGIAGLLFIAAGFLLTGGPDTETGNSDIIAALLGVGGSIACAVWMARRGRPPRPQASVIFQHAYPALSKPY